MAEPKVTVGEREYQVNMIVKLREPLTINPNGRGYEADNIKHTAVGDVLDVEFRAKTPEGIIKKATAFLETLKED